MLSGICRDVQVLAGNTIKGHVAPKFTDCGTCFGTIFMDRPRPYSSDRLTENRPPVGGMLSRASMLSLSFQKLTGMAPTVEIEQQEQQLDL